MKHTETKRIALCGMMAALSIVVLLLGAVLGLGIYLAPMVAGSLLIPVGHSCGRKYHVMLWLVVSALAFLLVPEIEEDLMFFLLFGCYPIFHTKLNSLPKGPRMILKLLFFNVVFIASELLILLILVPETVGSVYFAMLILLGNAMFLCYDLALPKAIFLLNSSLGKLFAKA